MSTLAIFVWPSFRMGATSLPAFSRKFFVTGEDEAFARRLITPRVADYFLEGVRGRVEYRRGWMLLAMDRRLSPQEISSQIEVASQLAELTTSELTRSKS